MSDPLPKLVVIDRDSLFLAALRRALAPQYAVAAFGDDWTYAQIVTLHPDLILLDVGMPELGAFELCRRLRVDSRFTKTPIIFLAASRTDEDYRRYLSAGGSRFLNKVIGNRHLLAALSEELAAAKPAAQAQPR